MNLYKKNSSIELKNYNDIQLKRNPRSDDEEEEEVIPSASDKHLGYFTRYQQSVCITIPIDEDVKQAKYYRPVAKAIADTKEGDQIEFEISSVGGFLSGLSALLTAMEKTEAVKVAHINGECHSAASILALSCDAIYVSPYATMLVHFVQFGVVGKSADIKSQVNHIHNTSEKLFKKTYKHFLTDVEINKCIEGLELYLDSDEINARLTRKFNILNKAAKKSNKVKPVEAEA